MTHFIPPWPLLSSPLHPISALQMIRGRSRRPACRAASRPWRSEDPCATIHPLQVNNNTQCSWSVQTGITLTNPTPHSSAAVILCFCDKGGAAERDPVTHSFWVNSAVYQQIRLCMIPSVEAVVKRFHFSFTFSLSEGLNEWSKKLNDTTGVGK